MKIVLGTLALCASLLTGNSVYAQTLKPQASVQSHCAVTKEELEVFTSYEFLSKTRTVVVTQTEPRFLDFDNLNLRLAAQGRGLPLDLRDDFKQKNISSCPFKAFADAQNLVFISEA